MSGRIITARHGCPDADRSVKITAQQYGDWWQGYDRAGLAPGERPPPALLEVAAEADVILSSTLPRAIETAAQLAPKGMDVPRDALFVEAPLPPPPVPGLRLTPTTWGVISRSFWFWGYAPGECETHGEAWKRVRQVVADLVERAQAGDNVLLCAHGYLNWMIDRHIRSTGWKKVAHEGRNDYWSHRVYEAR